MQIVSVNIGKAQSIQIGNKAIETGIYKQPTTGAVFISEYGLNGDAVVDQEHHGGRDQAIYVYSLEDYAWWSAQLGREVTAGTFGENLTLSSFPNTELKIGDRFQINDVLLEITSGRIPCSKLNARMDDNQFIKKFVEASRPGVYTRVIQTGQVNVNDSVTFLPAGQDYPFVNDLFALFYAKERDIELIRRGLDAPIAERARDLYQHWLDAEMI